MLQVKLQREGYQAESKSTKAVSQDGNWKLTPLEIAIEPLMDITGSNWDLMNPTKVSTCYRTDALITKDLISGYAAEGSMPEASL